MEEEKKTSEADKIAQVDLNPKPRRALSSTLLAEPIKTESRSSPFQGEIDRDCTLAVDGMQTKENCEHRASPGEILFEERKAMLGSSSTKGGEDDHSTEAQAVDDIAMSPISYDREDPMTLMDLPDDILALPISPCGPHDDPAGAALAN